MDNLKRIKRVALLLTALFGANLVVLAIMLPSLNLWIVSAMIVQVVIVIYLVGIITILLREYRELEEKNKNTDN